MEELKALGNKLFEKKEYEEAVEVYSQALDLAADNVALLCNRALCFIRLEKYGGALEDANAALVADPMSAKAHYRRGAALMGLLKYKDALEDFRAVMRMNPSDPIAKQKFTLCEKEVRRIAFEEAIESEATKALWQTLDISSMSIESTYDGPQVCQTLEDVRQIAEFMRGEKRVHKRMMCDILVRARKIFMDLPSLVDISVPEGNKITVCGDTHGQYYDLLNIFQRNGWPSSSNPYVFNGDFVDRGSFSVEVISLLLAFKVVDPTCIHLTRGNHESRSLNRVYGFEGEVHHKYNGTVYTLFQEVFAVLPLTVILNKRVMVVHGGIPADENVTLDDIRAISREGDIPESGVMTELLWADPHPGRGKIPSKRGVGTQFGSDITAAFLARNGLDLLVRSHEVKENGYEEMHHGKCITIFSAPNYCDQMGNNGAYIVFTANAGGALTKEYVQFQAVPHPTVRPMQYSSMGSFM
eukprot:ANDGO_06048.mRNA.1 Serine/threonine-protein phosphatase 5